MVGTSRAGSCRIFHGHDIEKKKKKKKSMLTRRNSLSHSSTDIVILPTNVATSPRRPAQENRIESRGTGGTRWFTLS